MLRLTSLLLLTMLLTNPALSVRADSGDWEYRVVILQGLAAGGSMEKQASGVYVDTRRTAALNELGADGWEVIAVIGAAGADHAVYLRRKQGR